MPDAITSDGHVVAFWPQPDGRLRFVWDGVAGEPFDELGLNRDGSRDIVSSDDGAHVAYVGARGAGWFVGRDGGEDPAIKAFSRSVPATFSPDGRHLAYGARVADEFRLIVDGQPIGDLPIAPQAAVFGPDGERLAFVEVDRSSRDHRCRIVLDGIPGPWFAGMRNAPGAMQFSPDSRRFAYFAIDERGHGQWVVDGIAQRLVNERITISLARMRGIGVVESPLAATFSPDSRRFAYFADVTEKGVAIVEDDVAGPRFKAVSKPVFSPDSRRMGYAATTYGGQSTLVVDGVAGPEWPASDSGVPVFSEDARHVAVLTLRTERHLFRKRYVSRLILDDRVFPEELVDDVSASPSFSPDGTRLVCSMRRGDEYLLIVDGMVHTGPAALLGDARFTKAGHLVHVGSVGNSVTVVVDDRPGPLADARGVRRTAGLLAGRLESPDEFSVSADGEHVAWAGQFGDDIRPVVDDHVGPNFDDILDSSFDAGGVATWYAQRGDLIYRVSFELGHGT